MSVQPNAIDQVRQQLNRLDAADETYATDFVAQLLQAAQASRVSDVHLTPDREQLDIRWRLDGVLHQLGQFPPGQAANIVSRLKVMALLLTYRSDIPQEGRIQQESGDAEMRVTTFPTLYGERAVVRFFASDKQYLYPDDLGLPDSVLGPLHRLLIETSGALVISGPAGSGKTTTAYACIRELVRSCDGGKCIVSLEDPIEVAIPGMAQSQVNPAADFDLVSGLRSILRQDPEALLIGEVRDRQTAEIALQASLTGQLVVTTFHAGSAAEAVSRLSDMGIEPYLLRSGILAILNQRLLRRLCHCAAAADNQADLLGLPVATAKIPAGCSDCLETGYQERLLISELLLIRATRLGRAIQSQTDSVQLEKMAVEAGMQTRWDQACEAVSRGMTSPVEVRRVLGFSDEEKEREGRRKEMTNDEGMTNENGDWIIGR